jgi:ubiquinone/menaquinone biosynthesis C-methylase UbiE
MSLDRSVNYEHIAPVFDRRYQENDYAGIERSLLEFVGSPPCKDVLEVGCGTGHWLEVLANAGYRAVGLEPARKMLEVAGSRLTDSVLVQGRAEALPWSESAFDRIVCINAFHQFSEQEKFIQQARRILRPGGGILISGLDPHTGLDRWWIYDYFPRVIEIDRERYPPAHKIQAMMLQNGFVECRTVETLHMPIRQPARYALEKGLLAKTSTSQLIVLTDEEYNRGMNQLLRDIESAEAAKRTFTIYADLRVYATTGWVPPGSGGG